MSYWYYFQKYNNIIYLNDLLKQKRRKLLKLGGLNPENICKNDNCSICLTSFNQKKLRKLPICNHTFHRKCIDHYFIYEKTCCPLCRQKY